VANSIRRAWVSALLVAMMAPCIWAMDARSRNAACVARLRASSGVLHVLEFLEQPHGPQPVAVENLRLQRTKSLFVCPGRRGRRPGRSCGVLPPSPSGGTCRPLAHDGTLAPRGRTCCPPPNQPAGWLRRGPGRGGAGSPVPTATTPPGVNVTYKAAGPGDVTRPLAGKSGVSWSTPRPPWRAIKDVD
jgi:hypothetical protein